jgi:hypothetical protein
LGVLVGSLRKKLCVKVFFRGVEEKEKKNGRNFDFLAFIT